MKRYLTAEEMKQVIEGKGCVDRIPITYQFWINPETFGDRKEEAKQVLNSYPEDVVSRLIQIPDVFKAPADDPTYRWVQKDEPKQEKKLGIDAVVAIEDWDELDDVLEHFPDPNYPGLFPAGPEANGKYILANWWYCLFERLWSLRGMENALTDFYTNPDEVHRLFDALATFYCRIIERSAKELHANGVFTSDDIGTQNGPFFSLEIFREFFKPYYKRIIDTAHANGMHFWLHTCGNIEMFLPDFIEIGLDVIHPIQKYTMEETHIAKTYGDKICIWAGFDVQQTIPYGTPEDVRKEVRFLIDTYYRKDGRFILTLGNAATADTPMESLKALLDETVTYGEQKCSKA